MKYFSMNYWSKLDDEEGIYDSYRSYISEIRTQLPASLQMLSSAGGNVLLNDGTIKELKISIDDATLNMIFHGKWIVDTTVGLRVFQLSYFGVSEVKSIVDPDGDPYPGYGDHGFDEIEVLGDKLFEHRILFSGGIELHIQFRDFKMTYEDIPNRLRNLPAPNKSSNFD